MPQYQNNLVLFELLTVASSIWSGTEVQIKVSEVSRLRRIQNRCTSHCCAPPKIYIYIRSLIFTDISHDTFGGTSSILAVREKKIEMALPQILPKFVFFSKIDIYASNFTLCGKAITTQLWNSHMFCFGKDVQYYSLSVTSLSSMSWFESRIFMSVMSLLLIMMLVTLLSCPEHLIMMLVAYWLSWTTKNVKCQWIQLQLF